jgi:hypothetical protein
VIAATVSWWSIDRIVECGRLGLDGAPKEVWAERAKLLAPYQVNAELARRYRRAAQSA